MDVLLRLGPECNQKCVFCNVPDCVRLSSKQAEDWINSLNEEMGILSITGGEPTLRKDLLMIIKKAAESKMVKFVNLQTNAAMASYKEYAADLKKAGLYSAFVAFHSHDEHTSNKLTNSDLWSKSVQGIKNLINESIIVSLNPVVNKLNYKLLPGYVEFVKEQFPCIKQISFSFVQPAGRAWENKWIVPTYTEVKPYLKKALEYCKENNINFVNPYCGFPICCFPETEELSHEYEDNEIIGAKEEDAVRRVKNEKIKPGSCRDCKYDSRCNGVWIGYAKIHGLSELKPLK